MMLHRNVNTFYFCECSQKVGSILCDSIKPDDNESIRLRCLMAKSDFGEAEGGRDSVDLATARGGINQPAPALSRRGTKGRERGRCRCTPTLTASRLK